MILDYEVTLQPLLSVSEAKFILLEHFSPLEREYVSLENSIGRVLGEQVFSEFDLPQFPNSSMDGFAVRSEDLDDATPEDPVILKVVEDIPAGYMPQMVVETGQCSRIMTGAPLPAGADAVVPIEDTDQFVPGNRTAVLLESQVSVYRSLKSVDYVRSKGEDIQSGQEVLPTGRRLRPQDVGLLAMLGISDVAVIRRPRIAIMSTGDELTPIGTPLDPGKIHDSNAYTLTGQIIRDGGFPVNLGIAPDREDPVFEVLERAVSSDVDLILSTAGVSVGAFDYVKSVVEQHGRIEFWRVNMRPGKPLTFGRYRDIPFIGLPGNPVSAFVGYEIFVRSAIYRLCGITDAEQITLQVRLLDPIESDGRESYLRAIVARQGDHWKARLTGHQGSGNLLSLVQANALLVIPSGVKSLPSDSVVDAIILNTLD